MTAWWRSPCGGGPLARRPGGGASGRAVLAPMHGTILRLLVREGDRVAPGDAVAILEAMKMETHVSASAAGTVREVRVMPGSVVEAGEVVATIGAAGEEGERPCRSRRRASSNDWSAFYSGGADRV